MIEVDELSKRFDETLAVDRLSLSVAPGEIVGLVGANGAGKTTFLRMLAGILPPDSGRVHHAGHPLEGDAVAARRTLAFVPDTPMLFEALTVLEHLVFVARLYDVPDPAPRFEALLAEFELDERRHHTAAALSRGMRQKLAICCAFVHDPTSLLLDEPLTGLDPPARRQMARAIAARAQAGAAVIVSSHQLEFVERLCNRFVVVKRGRVKLEGTLASIAAACGGAQLEDVFLEAMGSDVEERSDGVADPGGGPP